MKQYVWSIMYLIRNYGRIDVEIEGGWVTVKDGVLTVHEGQFDDPLFLVAVHALVRVKRLREVPEAVDDPIELLERDLEKAEYEDLGLRVPANPNVPVG